MSGRGNVIGGIFHALALFLVMGSAFAIGCILNFLKHPMSWISEFWFPILLFVIAIIGMIKQKRVI